MTDDLERRLRAFTTIMTLGGNFDTARAVMFEAADELARLRAENERLREAVKIALTCTPSARNGEVIYDCGNPWEILGTALQEGSRYDR